VFRADSATHIGPPTEKNESDRIEWIPLARVRDMIDRREIVSSGSLVGLLYLLMEESEAH
ncbi:NUDIX hydrolase, partial [Streptomyces xiamenensis]